MKRPYAMGGAIGTFLGILLVAASLLLANNTVEADMMEWCCGSWIQHDAGEAQWTKPLGSIASSPWLGYHNGAVSEWNSDIGDNPFDPVESYEYAQVHTLVAESSAEDDLNYWMVEVYGFTEVYSCEYADPNNTNWGSVAPYWHGSWDPGVSGGAHEYHSYKVCLWTWRVASGYQELTIQHELGHVLSLWDDEDEDNCSGGTESGLMGDGAAMTVPCEDELDAVRDHYNR